ncbi:MAG: hypothetical protein LBJ72_03050 [Dysgonamonadaceae bacterium]|jgi:hypothetical protein|nr:hypothetical protein [Dysgonamonadaceae bacterium]
MKIALFIVCFVLVFSLSCFAQAWRDKMEELVYTPKYFGANAFPVPEVRSGKLSDKYELEVRYDYHYNKGDKTRNIFGRVFIPFGKGIVALDIRWVPVEYYKTSKAIMHERNASSTDPHGDRTHGDAIAIVMFQLLRNKKWFDAETSLGLKTASGNMLVDARHTDAVNYWFDAHVGRDVFSDEKQALNLRLVMMGGFYCYMTNSLVHRQNDAWMLGGGVKAQSGNIFLDVDIRGFKGYWNQGDRPVLFHTKLKYAYKNHAIYFRYQDGFHDYIYQTYSGGYIFSF